MQIILNGQPKDIAESSFLHDLVTACTKSPDCVVAEVNGIIIPQNNWSAARLIAGDKVELVSFVGGG